MKNKRKKIGFTLIELLAVIIVLAITNVDSSNNLWYEESVLKVQKDGKYGLINMNGNLILPAEYDKIEAVLGVKNVNYRSKKFSKNI